MASANSKLGRSNISLAWRYYAYFDPKAYGFEKYTYTKEQQTKSKNSAINQRSNKKGSLKRSLLSSSEGGIITQKHKVTYVLPETLYHYSDVLTTEQYNMLFRVWDKAFKKQGKNSGKGIQKIDCQGIHVIDGESYHIQSWNIAKVRESSLDPFFKKVIYHQTGVEYDHGIKEALAWYEDQKHTKTRLRYLGAALFARFVDPYSHDERDSDEHFAYRWRMPRDVFKAIKLLFFDFSHLPTDRIAMYASLRQMESARQLEPEDFSLYKYIFDMGRLALHSQFDYHRLALQEKQMLQLYLGEALVNNTLNLKLAIDNKNDGYKFQSALTNLASVFHREDDSLKQMNIELVQARVENIRESTEKLRRDSVSGDSDLNNMDQEGIELLETLSLQEHSVDDLRTFAELDA